MNAKNSQIVSIIDKACLVSLSFFLFLALIFSGKVNNWIEVSVNILVYLVMYAIFTAVIKKIKNENIQVLLYTTTTLVVISFLFGAVGNYQHIWFSEWMDEKLIAIDKILFGQEISIVFESITTPLLTEWMMFAYVAYIPLLSVTAFICYFSSNSETAYKYLLCLLLTNIVCFIGFIFFPVASPLFYQPENYSVPLEGGIFSYCGEWIRQNMHYPGGALPSPHCAASTVIAIFLYKNNRHIFFLLFPILITIYFSTVYGRYHYMWDAVTGIFTALSVVYLFKKLMKFNWQFLKPKSKSAIYIRHQSVIKNRKAEVKNESFSNWRNRFYWKSSYRKTFEPKV